jgi:dipeptidyl aminopeptidase/acylaminoacyl peptidase
MLSTIFATAGIFSVREARSQVSGPTTCQLGSPEVSTTTARAASPLTLELFLKLRRPVEVELSPDGGRFAMTVSPVAKERGTGLEARLWVSDVGGEPAPVGEAGETAAAPRFSPDGTRLAYASDQGHAGRLSLRVHDRGELGSITGSVEDLRWAADGRSLLVLAADLGSDRAGAQTATKIREQGAAEADPKVFRPAQYWRRLFLVDAATGETREAGPEGVNVFEFDWVGGRAVAVCTDDPSEGAWYDAWLGLVDVGSRTVERVHTPEWQLQSPSISPGGKVAWIEGFASDRGTVTGTVHLLGAGPVAPELDVTWLSFADEDTLWYAGWRGSGSLAGRLHVDGAAEELHGGDLVVGSRFQPRISPSVDGSRVAAVLETVEDPPEIVLFENGSTRILTALNEELRPHLQTAAWRRYTWESFDGLEIEGLLALPRGGNGAHPLVVNVHGGPTATWCWSVSGHALLLAQEGYAVFLPNPRGSVGRGQEFARANLGDLGGDDLKDILAGVDALVRDGIADDGRVAITGGSYGGFMSSWAVTQTDRFAAAIPCAVVTDWLSFHLTTNIGRWDRMHMNADPYDAVGEYPKRSAVYHAQRCTTPTLILHGEDDLCTPLSQASELYNALVEAGCETELVVYPREGHGWLEREHQLDSWQRLRDWLAQHLG